MKYYETTLNDYVEKVLLFNIHNEHKLLNQLKEHKTIENMIFYGPSGVGKYSQMLFLLSNKIGKFKSQQKLYVQKDNKEKYTYIMSDIYFEIDMGLLGCNSKTLWHEIYLQILDIVIIKPKKTGIIVFKNFHLIHSELLDIFYSYIQDNYKEKDISIKYIIITEQISFIPNNILNNFIIINIPRVNSDIYNKIIEINLNSISPQIPKKISNNNITDIVNIKDIFCESDRENIFNQSTILKTICNNIIEQIENSDKIVITNFRDDLYEILTYGLDIGECLWYILSYFYKKGVVDNILIEYIYDFLKKFNNNYRPITHLESIFTLFILYYRKHKNLTISI